MRIKHLLLVAAAWGGLFTDVNPALHDQQDLDEGSSAYCQARKRVPLDALTGVRAALAAFGEKTAQLWHGLRPKLIDGTTITLPDTQKNQRKYPQSRNQKPGCGFPLMK